MTTIFMMIVVTTGLPVERFINSLSSSQGHLYIWLSAPPGVLSPKP